MHFYHYARYLGDLKSRYCVLCYSLICGLGIRPSISFITKSLTIRVGVKWHSAFKFHTLNNYQYSVSCPCAYYLLFAFNLLRDTVIREKFKFKCSFDLNMNR